MPIEKVAYTIPVPAGVSFFSKAGVPYVRFKRKGRFVEARVHEDGKRCTVETPEWYVRYKDAKGKWKRKKGYTDHRMTQDLEKRLILRVARQENDPFAEHRERPLSEHVDDFEKGLEARNLNAQHVQQVVRRVCSALRNLSTSSGAEKPSGPFQPATSRS